MGLFLERGGDQIRTLAAQADTQASGLLFRLLFTAAAHGCCGQTATSQRQQAQASVERYGGAISTIRAVRQIVAHLAILHSWGFTCPKTRIYTSSITEIGTSVRITTNPISNDITSSILPCAVERHRPQNHRCKEGPEG